MACCKKEVPQNIECNNFSGNYFFIVLILYILLAIVIGGSLFY